MHTRINKNRLIAVASVATFVYGMIASLAGTIVPQLSDRLKIAPDLIANVFLAQAVGMVIASLVAGPLVDNHGKKTGITLALSLISIALFAMPSSSNYAAILGCMALLGVGAGTLVTSSNALVSDVDPKRRATILTFMKCFFGAGGFVTPFLGASILGGSTITLCYVIAGCTVATLVFAVATVMPPPSGDRGFKLSEVRVVTGQPVLYLFSLMVFLYVACEVGVFNWLAKHLISQGMPQHSALQVLSFGFSLGILGGRLACVGILLKVPAITVTIAGSAGMAITTYALVQANSGAAAGVLAFLTGVSMAPIFPSVLALTGDRFPRMTATAFGVVITSGWLGLAISSRLIGAIAGPDPLGIRTGLLVLPVFSVAIFLIALIVRRLVGRPRFQAGESGAGQSALTHKTA